MIKDTDKGYRALMSRVRELARARVTVGVHAAEGDAPHEGGTTVLEVAVANEFGTKTIPERSFIRGWFDESRDDARRWLLNLVTQAVAGKITNEKAFEQFGAKAQGEIQKRIAQGIPPPNAPSTIKRKGSDKPLINTGQLRSAIRYKVFRT